MPSNKPLQVNFTRDDLMGAVNRNLDMLKPPAPVAPAGLDRYAAIRQAIRVKKGLIGGRPQTL